MANRLCNALGIEYPVIQGAMAWTSMAPLVAAVSEAGGLGVLGSGFMPKEVILEQIRAVRSMTSKPFAANLILDPGEQFDATLAAITEEHVSAVYMDTLGLLQYDTAKEHYGRFHAAGCKIIAKINVLQDAIVAQKAGADVIICKGVEGGGHCTKISGRVLLAEVVEHVGNVPIVASGGIGNARQAAACVVAGADGIEMGTAFMATEECPVHPNVKQAILNAQDMDIVACGASTGEPSWQIRNKLAEKLLQIEAERPQAEAAKLVQELAAGSIRTASLEGEVEEKGAVMSGQVAGLIHTIQPIRNLIVDFCQEWQTWLQKTYTLY